MTLELWPLIDDKCKRYDFSFVKKAFQTFGLCLFVITTILPWFKAFNRGNEESIYPNENIAVALYVTSCVQLNILILVT